MKKMKKIGILLLSLFFFCLITVPELSLANDLRPGNFFVRLRAYNGETIVYSPHETNAPFPNTAEVSVVYDGNDHGFIFQCVSNSIYSSKFVTTAGIISSCTATNENGEEVPCTLIDTNEMKAAFLTKPDAGQYTITIIGSWTSGMITGEASLIVTFNVEKAEISDFVEITPYTGVYDGAYHDALQVTANEIAGDYQIEYKKGQEAYTTTRPKVKKVSDSDDYYCRITSLNPNFNEQPYETSVPVVIQKKTVSAKVPNYSKCSGNPDPEYQCIITGLVNSEQLVGLTYSREEGENAGQYLITASIDPDANPNYNVVLESGILTVNEHMLSSWQGIGATCTEAGWQERICYNCGTKERQTLPALGHNWNNGEITTPATCTADGVKTYTCSRCDAIHTETIPALGGHIWNEGEVTSSATCTADGVTTYTCDRCGETRTESIPALGHEWGEVNYIWNDEHSELTATRTCVHDTNHVEKETVGASAEVTREVTCTIPGETTYTSSNFENEAFEAQVVILADIAAPGHTIVTDPAVEATCTHTGLTAGSHCSVCDEVLVAQEVVPMKAHTYAVVPETPATCEETGLTSYVACTSCGLAVMEGEVIPALGHSWGVPTYVWSVDNTKVTAVRICTRDASHTHIDTACVQRIVTVSPTQTTEGTYKLVSSAFEDEDLAIQEKTGGRIPALGTLNVLKLPADLREIEAEAFENLDIQAIIVPDNCTIIGNRAFTNCRDLVYAYIPASVTSLAEDAFEGCPDVALERVIN